MNGHPFCFSILAGCDGPDQATGCFKGLPGYRLFYIDAWPELTKPFVWPAPTLHRLISHRYTEDLQAYHDRHHCRANIRQNMRMSPARSHYSLSSGNEQNRQGVIDLRLTTVEDRHDGY